PENGYQEAQVIVNGELVPGIGGGVCQVGTTLFNAAFFAGLPIVERSNHSLHISKYPLGRDATVNYGHQDLKFRNDTPYGFLLKAFVTSKALTLSVYSTKLGRTVEYTTSERRNTKPPPTQYVDDPTLPAGQEVVQEEGSAGFDVTVTRTVREGENVLHQGTFVSKYRPWKRIVRKGTGPPAASPQPSPAA
ncbi:MAG: VanW family protein, partial [Acidimicrobiia bacterium]